MRSALIRALLLLLCAAPALAQTDEPARIALPLDAWAAEGERSDIKWNVKLAPPALMYNQRQAAGVFVSIPLKDLQRQSVARELHTVIKLKDENGRWLPGEAYEVQVFQERMPPKTRLELHFMMFLRPGRYAVHAFLFDRVREQRNHARREVVVAELKRDPLPAVGRDFPPLEFVEWNDRTGARRDLPGRLYLPVNARRPLRLDIIVNFSARPSRTGRLHRNNTQTLLEMLGVLAQLQLPENSAVRLTALDVLGRRVLFQFDDVSGLDLPRLRDFLAAELNPHTVDVDTLARRLESAEFFRAHMERALAQRPPARSAGLRGGGEAAADAERVFLLLGAPTLFPFRTPVRRLGLKEGCDCRFFYLRRAGYREGIYELGVWDQVERILDPIDPRVFEVAEPRDLRKAIAAIIRELER